MWGIFKTLFSSESNSGKVIDGVYNGLDKMVYTDEERADNHARLLKLYEPFKVAQRLLACIFGIPYALAWFVTFVASFFIGVDTQLDLLGGKMGIIVGVIVGFYFGGGWLESKNKGK